MISFMTTANGKDKARASVPPDEAETHVFKAINTYAFSRLNIMLLDVASDAENMAFILSIDHLKKL